MRIISGSYKGRKLISPRNFRIRPTSDRNKEMIFNWVHFFLKDKNILDLFAGTGNLGFEALSRTAQHATFVDHSGNATQIIIENANLLNLQDKVTIIREDVFKALKVFSKCKTEFDFIFADPPYNCFLSTKILSEIASHKILKAGGGLILEHSKSDVPNYDASAFKSVKQKFLGETAISYYQRG